MNEQTKAPSASPIASNLTENIPDQIPVQFRPVQNIRSSGEIFFKPSTSALEVYYLISLYNEQGVYVRENLGQLKKESTSILLDSIKDVPDKDLNPIARSAAPEKRSGSIFGGVAEKIRSKGYINSSKEVAKSLNPAIVKYLSRKVFEHRKAYNEQKKEALRTVNESLKKKD